MVKSLASQNQTNLNSVFSTCHLKWGQLPICSLSEFPHLLNKKNDTYTSQGYRQEKKVHRANPEMCQGQHKASNNSSYYSDWLSKLWYIDKVEYCLAIKNDILEQT